MALKAGIIGTGTIALDHAVTCLGNPKVELAAACDLSAEAVNAFGDRFRVPNRYTDLDRMLSEERLDIAIVATWGPAHAPVSIAAANSGNVRAILCEKPIAGNAAECEAMVTAARQNGVVLVEAFKWRHDPQHVRIKEIIDSGRIGRVVSVQATFSSPLVRFAEPDNWRYDRRRGGGSVYDTACYLIHFSRFVIGEEPHRAYAVGRFIETADADMTAVIQLEFPGGATAQLTSSYQYGYCQATEVLGLTGWIRADLPFDQRSVREQEFVEKEDLPATVEVFHDNFDHEVHRFAAVDQFALQFDHLVECLETDTPHRIPAEFSLGNMRVIDAVYESMRTRKPVDLESN
jgi:predicted dehydrogenase